MPLLMKHTGPLWGIWKIEEPSEVLFALLQNRKEYLPQLELIRTEQRRREWLASRVLLQELTGGSALIAYHPNGLTYPARLCISAFPIRKAMLPFCYRIILPPASTSNTVPRGCRGYAVVL